MNYLFLDTASSRVIISVIRNNEIVFTVNLKNDNNLSNKLMVLIDENFKKYNLKATDINKLICEYTINTKKTHSQKLMPMIENMLNISDLNINEIDLIAVCEGPGSFTGIRCGVTVAKTLAFLLNIEITAISELETMVSGYDEQVCPIIDARRGYVFAGIYDGVKNLAPDRYISYDEITKGFKGKIVSYDYENAYEPKIDILKLVNKHKDESINPHLLVPNYLKKTEAEENLDAKRNQ